MFEIVDEKWRVFAAIVLLISLFIGISSLDTQKEYERSRSRIVRNTLLLLSHGLAIVSIIINLPISIPVNRNVGLVLGIFCFAPLFLVAYDALAYVTFSRYNFLKRKISHFISICFVIIYLIIVLLTYG